MESCRVHCILELAACYSFLQHSDILRKWVWPFSHPHRHFKVWSQTVTSEIYKAVTQSLHCTQLYYDVLSEVDFDWYCISLPLKQPLSDRPNVKIAEIDPIRGRNEYVAPPNILSMTHSFYPAPLSCDWFNTHKSSMLEFCVFVCVCVLCECVCVCVCEVEHTTEASQEFLARIAFATLRTSSTCSFPLTKWHHWCSQDS